MTSMTTLGRHVQGHFAVLYVKNLVEKDFDEGEFLESAKDAFFTGGSAFEKTAYN